MAGDELVPRSGTGLSASGPLRPYTRPLSPVERVWLVADALEPPFAPALVLEGEGALDADAFERAVTQAAGANPGVAVLLRGVLRRTRWVGGGPAPRVRRVDGAAWDGRGPAGAPWLAERIDPRRGPLVEVLLVEGAPPRVVFRMHHAVMDGRGLLLFVDDVFRALRGEALEGSASEVTDVDLARALSPAKNSPRREDCLAPTGARRGAESRSTWRRLSVAGRVSRPLPAVLHCIANIARTHSEGDVRVGIPVDLRDRTQVGRSTANLTGILDLELPVGAGPPELQAALEGALAQHRAAAFVLEAEFIRGIPLWLATAVARASTRRVCRANRYNSSGTVSNLGLLPVERFAAPDFRTRAAFLIPPGTPSHACFVTLCGHAGGLEAVVTMPEDLASDGRLDALVVALGAALSASAAPPRLA